jgi:poly-beta-1,6-N-acetyl-D-glucosamine biosynthesis protein PgaD
MSQNIIDGRQKKKIKVVEAIITFMGWLVMVGFALQILLSVLLWYFNLSEFYRELFMPYSVPETVRVVFVTLSISVLCLSVMYIWGRYNLKKFGPLNRRTFPVDTTVEEVAQFFNLPLEMVQDLQNSKALVLEKTIV